MSYVPGASLQNIANYFSQLQVKPSISQHCVGDIFSGGRKKKEKEMGEQNM
jgi:hypothetical protein